MHTPFSLFQTLKHSYIKYIETRDRFKDSSLQKERYDILDKSGTIYQEPLIEPIVRYEDTGNSVKEDCKNLNLNEFYDFISIEDYGLFPRNKDFKFYKHQKEALEEAHNYNKNIVITTGTGSGKTESFLLPVIANILDESKRNNWPKANNKKSNYDWWINNSDFIYQREHENRPAAVRALILYPLNALVEDQLKRLRKLLDNKEKDGSRDWIKANRNNNLIYFGRYTGKTPTPGNIDNIDAKEKKNLLKKLAEELKIIDTSSKQCFIGSNKEEHKEGQFFVPKLDGAEMYSRFDMQTYPPDILITNYSMLNIMLMRSVESNIFEATKKWLKSDPKNKFQLVIDELHTYRGTAGTEIAYLLRVLFERLGIDPNSDQLQILASSASFGEGEQPKEFLRQFFGTQKEFKIIDGNKYLPKPKKIDIEEFRNYAKYFSDFYDQIESDDNLNDSKKIFIASAELYKKIVKDNTLIDKKDFSEILYDTLTKINAYEITKNLFHKEEKNSHKYLTLSVKDIIEKFNQNFINEKVIKGLISAVALSRKKNTKSESISPLEFRVHYLFRNLSGLWACSNPNCFRVENKEENRKIGKIYTEPKLICDCGSRVLELLICRNCGETLLGGYYKSNEKNKSNSYYLFPEQPNLEQLPELCNNQKNLEYYTRSKNEFGFL